ncbi:hypothetical protein JKP88DRAFT_256265 [Tribonema minus]|uniref:Helicase ATP-binding domain-containing protein n=1 Tax=Tribonema minus TaxID=303371 RepID=A0A835YYG4_9STRA|nr:hypothetical protein JKP88DRAFT_256265 [Tribonema minus]
MQKPRVMESRCGLAKKSNYRKMNYDLGSSTYDPEYGSDEEDRDNTGKAYPFEPETYQRAVAQMAAPSWHMNLLMYWGPGSEWRKGPIDREQKAPAGSPYWEIPRVGCIIVDEAHNLFDTSQMKTSQHSNHAVKFIDQMLARPDIRRLFSTGTPVADSSSFTNLMKLLDLLRHPSPPGADMLASAPACTQTVELEGGDTGRMTDIDELEDIAKASKQADRNAINEQLRKYANERAVRKPWFYQLPNDDYMWKPCAEHTFKQMTYGYVSYVNMEADATAFPQFGVQWSGRKYPKGMVYTKFRPSDFDIAESGLLTELAQKRKGKGAGIRASKQPKLTAASKFEFQDFESSGKGPSVLVVDVPTHQPNLHAEEARLTTQGQIGKHFTQIKDVPFKWFALRQALQINSDVKHFIFLEKQTDDLLRKFCTWFEKAMKEDSTVAADDPMKKPKLFTLPSRYNDTWTDEQVEQHIIALNKGKQRVYRYMILGDELMIKSSLRFFNATCNKGGDYIAIVMGLSTVKEQVTISDTNFVHLLQAPTSATMLNQVIRRVARRCSMSNIEPINRWLVTVVIYHTPESKKEVAWLTKSMGAANTPVELAYRALQSTAIDCALYTALTGVNCDDHKAQDIETYCLYPRGGTQRLIKMVTGSNGTMYSEPDCINDEGIPGGLLEYGLWDEILYQLLSKSKRYTARPIPPEAAPDLIRKFPTTVKSTLRTGVWIEEGQAPKLTFARDVPPEVLARWIDATPAHVGNAVLFLIQNKRSGADQQVVKKLHQKARMYVERAEFDVALHDSLEQKTKALQSLRDDFTFNLNDLKSASLRVDTAGRAAQQLIERNARYI